MRGDTIMKLDEVDGNSPVLIEFGKELLSEKSGWTAEELGLELSEEEQLIPTREDSKRTEKSLSTS